MAIGGHSQSDTLPREERIGEGITMNEVTEGDVPPIEIRPIFRSGGQNNRLDLVLFCDGCEFLK